MTRIERIKAHLTLYLNPTELIIEDESQLHHVPINAETHFKTTVVSDKFNSLSKVARHRLVYGLLREEFNSGLHALSLHLYTEEEWQNNTTTPLNSPACLDGFNNE